MRPRCDQAVGVDKNSVRLRHVEVGCAGHKAIGGNGGSGGGARQDGGFLVSIGGNKTRRLIVCFVGKIIRLSSGCYARG